MPRPSWAASATVELAAPMHGLGFHRGTSGSRLGLRQQHAGGHDVLQLPRGGSCGSGGMMQRRSRCSSHAYAASALAQHRSPREQQHQASLQARLCVCVLVSRFHTLLAGARMLILHCRWSALVGAVQRGCSSCLEPCRAPNSGGWTKMAGSLCQVSPACVNLSISGIAPSPQNNQSQAAWLVTGTLPGVDARHSLPAAAAALDRALQQQRQQQPPQPSLPAASLQRGFAGLSFVLTSATDNTADGCAAVICSRLCCPQAVAGQIGLF
jgi:hypothetical protein